VRDNASSSQKKNTEVNGHGRFFESVTQTTAKLEGIYTVPFRRFAHAWILKTNGDIWNVKVEIYQLSHQGKLAFVRKSKPHVLSVSPSSEQILLWKG